MTQGQRDAEEANGNIKVPGTARRERITVRRRRPRSKRDPNRWVAARARHQRARMVALSAGFLLLMALGLYYGLSRQEGGGLPQGTRGRTPLVSGGFA